MTQSAVFVFHSRQKNSLTACSSDGRLRAQLSLTLSIMGKRKARPQPGSAVEPQFAILDPPVTDEEVTATSVCVKASV